jgi:hypothetical protein
MFTIGGIGKTQISKALGRRGVVAGPVSGGLMQRMILLAEGFVLWHGDAVTQTE